MTNIVTEAAECIHKGGWNAVYDRLLAEKLIEPGETIYTALTRLTVSQNTFGPFKRGDYVRKKSGAWWEGFVVGGYSTEQTPDGVCVQLDKPMGPVQIYPASALELVAKESAE